MMNRALRPLTLLLILIPLSGCTFFKTVFFSSSDESFVRKDSEVKLEVFAGTDPKKCDDTVKPPEAAALAVPLIAAATQIAVNIAASELEAYLAEKQKEFTYSFSGTLNRPYYYVRSSKPHTNDKDASIHYKNPFYNCLKLTRRVPTPTEADKNKTDTVFEWTAGLVPSEAGTALKIKTIDLKVAKGGARTGKENKIDLKIVVKIDATTHNEKGEITTTTVADKTLAYPEVVLGDNSTPVKFKDVESTWFTPIPRSKIEAEKCDEMYTHDNTTCPGISPISVSLAVTETGSGSAAFGDLAKEVSDNKKTLGDALNKAISDALKPASSSGSSK
jgi:hypothetical protein